jgi:hypothetical protein
MSPCPTFASILQLVAMPSIGVSRPIRLLHSGDHAPEGTVMNSIRIAAIAFIIAGALGLLYGGFSYTKETHDVKLGPVELSVKEKRSVNIPVWAGAGAILLGGVLLVVGAKKR